MTGMESHRAERALRDVLERASAAASGVPGELDALQATAWLRARHDPVVAREAALTRELRRRAAAKLGSPESLLLTRRGLEQATCEAVASERARRIHELCPDATVLDATAGIGGDALELARAGLSVVISDRDPRTVLFARENLAAVDGRGRAVVADALRPAVRADLVLVDPDRRGPGESGPGGGSADRRTLDPERWSPRLSEAVAVASRFAGGCLKLAPALDPDRVRLPADLAHRWRWVSWRGELMETALWTGVLAPEHATAPREREAVVLRPAETLSVIGEPIAIAPLEPAEAERVRWLCDPDPAVVRAGLLGLVARRAGAAPLAPGIGFLGATEEPASGPYRTWRVVATTTADRRRVRRMLAEHDVGPVEVLRRGHPESPAELARAWRGTGARRGVVAVARLERGHLVLLLESPGEAADRD